VIWSTENLLKQPLGKTRYFVKMKITKFVLTSALVLTASSCSQNKEPVATSTKEVCFDGGSVTLGSTEHYPEEQPLRSVKVAPFCLDAYEVSVSRYERFVQATGYKTVAETGPNPSDYPGQPPEYFQPGSAVFVFPARSSLGRWSFKPLANWRDPQGTSTSLIDAEDHPVTHIAFEDAQRYASWLDRRLPTEAEWEFAAKHGGNVVDLSIDERTGKRNVSANIWDGEFPIFNTKLDGYAGTSPIGSYVPDVNGVYDLLGNVWEWTADTYDKKGASTIEKHVIKGGSHLCASNFCARFRPEARQPQEHGLGTSHIGFRTARDKHQ